MSEMHITQSFRHADRVLLLIEDWRLVVDIHHHNRDVLHGHIACRTVLHQFSCLDLKAEQ